MSGGEALGGRVRRPQLYGGGAGDLAAVLDCSDLDRSARFWTAALGYVEEASDADSESNSYRSLLPRDGAGIELLLQAVPEAKRAKNRLHLDLRTRDLDVEVGRVIALGATLVTSEPTEENGWTWHVLADPDGNELCVVRPPPTYWADREAP